jgi:hypothetical protein
MFTGIGKAFVSSFGSPKLNLTENLLGKVIVQISAGNSHSLALSRYGHFF